MYTPVDDDGNVVRGHFEEDGSVEGLRAEDEQEDGDQEGRWAVNFRDMLFFSLGILALMLLALAASLLTDDETDTPKPTEIVKMEHQDADKLVNVEIRIDTPEQFKANNNTLRVSVRNISGNYIDFVVIRIAAERKDGSYIGDVVQFTGPMRPDAVWSFDHTIGAVEGYRIKTLFVQPFVPKEPSEWSYKKLDTEKAP